MPYIEQWKRDGVNPVSYDIDNSGELNFLISSILDGFIRNRGLCYETLNAAIGALECAKLELYRRIAAPYEDKKLAENGDVYTIKP